MLVTIHINPKQPHQQEHGQWFLKGFKRLGIKAEVTTSISRESDVHIVSGPHFAKDRWLGHPRTILLDRAYYRDGSKPSGMASMPDISLGWMREDGGRIFELGSGRNPPTPKDRPSYGGTIFLADYGGPIERADTIRYHPADKRPGNTLSEALRGHRTAIGYQTTALVTAALEGLEIVCKDKRNIMFEKNWLQLLPYADWHYSEIESGEALDFLWQQI
jgi:hypothetical protein